MNCDAIVRTLRVDEDLAQAAAHFVKHSRVRLGCRRKLPSFGIDELVVGEIGVPDQRSAMRMKQAPPYRTTRAVLDEAVPIREGITRFVLISDGVNHDRRGLQ